MTPPSSDLPEREIRFIMDVESDETMTWLLNADRIVTHGMGGTLAESPDFSGIGAIVDLGCGPGGWVLAVAQQHPDIQVTGSVHDPLCTGAGPLTWL